jgi:tetratricopeptide (TPR) repeat protein
VKKKHRRGPDADATTSSSSWQPRLDQEMRLRRLDEMVARSPDAIDTQVERAALLNALGRTVEARDAYLDVLQRAPTHFGALNDFGAMLSAIGFRSAARTVLSQAIAHHPNNPKAYVNLANLLLNDGELATARAHYETALRLCPEHPQAHQGLGTVLAELGDHIRAERHRRKGYERQFIATLPYRGTNPPIEVLMLVSGAGGNIPTASFLDDRVFRTCVVIADYFDAAAELPPHHVVFNAIGDADLCAPALAVAAALLERTTAPVINHPRAVCETGRAANAQRLAALPGVVTPHICIMPRAVLASPNAALALTDQGLAFPLLLRSPGFHTGRHFVRIESAAELPATVENLPGDQLLAIEYLDARGPDGMARKFRVMIVDRRIYPLHLAISSQWKVHYFTADMAENPEHRAQDAAFLDNMPAMLGSGTIATLERIAGALDLDYAGIDFGVGPSGEVLLFEANATMVVNPPDPDERWAYRRPAVTRILDAVGAMLRQRATGCRGLEP